MRPERGLTPVGLSIFTLHVRHGLAKGQIEDVATDEHEPRREIKLSSNRDEPLDDGLCREPRGYRIPTCPN
jgi:hypothetical protein